MHNPFDLGYYNSEELRSFGFARIGECVQIAKTCKIFGLENITVGDNSRIDDFCTIIGTGPLVIGNRVHIHSYCQIGARGGVTFEDFSALASGCFIYSASDDPLGRYMVGGVAPAHCTRPKIAPVVFSRHSAVFAQSTVLPGVTLNEGAVACAHSLVSHDVPEWTIVSGAPARHRLNRSRRLLSLDAEPAQMKAA